MSRLQANLLLLVVSLIWGTTFVVQKNLEGVGIITFTGLRFVLGTLAISPLVYREYKKRQQTIRLIPQTNIYLYKKNDFVQLAMLGVFLFVAALLQQVGIASTSVTNAGFLTGFYVPMVPLLSWLILRQRPHWSVWPLSIGCVIGIGLLSGIDSLTFGSGDSWVLASCPFWALQIVFVGRIAERLNSPFLVAFSQFFVAGVLGLVWGLIKEPFSLAGMEQASTAILYAGLISVGIAYTGQVIAQRYTQAADAAIVMSSETLFASFFGFLLLGEVLDFEGILGCILILLCIVLIQLLPLFSNRRLPSNVVDG